MPSYAKSSLESHEQQETWWTVPPGMTYLRKILGVTRMDRIHNTKIRDRLNNNQNLVDIIHAKQLSYFTYINRMPPYGYPKFNLEYLFLEDGLKEDPPPPSVLGWQHQVKLSQVKTSLGGWSRSHGQQQTGLAQYSCKAAISKTKCQTRTALSQTM